MYLPNRNYGLLLANCELRISLCRYDGDDNNKTQSKNSNFFAIVNRDRVISRGNGDGGDGGRRPLWQRTTKWRTSNETLRVAGRINFETYERADNEIRIESYIIHMHGVCVCLATTKRGFQLKSNIPCGRHRALSIQSAAAAVPQHRSNASK